MWESFIGSVVSSGSLILWLTLGPEDKNWIEVPSSVPSLVSGFELVFLWYDEQVV